MLTPIHTAKAAATWPTIASPRAVSWEEQRAIAEATSRRLSTVSVLLLTVGVVLPSCGAAAAPPDVRLACPQDTAQKTLTSKCGTMVVCARGGPEDLSTIQGPVREFYPSGGKRAEYTLLNWQVRVGPIVAWHPNGMRRLEARYGGHGSTPEMDFEGVVTEWYSNGRKHAEATFKQGARDGGARLWSPTGVLRIEGNWKSGDSDGKWKSFFPDGKPEIELSMKKGHLDGAVSIWAVNGQKIEEFSQFDDEKRGPRRMWTPQGKLLLEEAYQGGALHGPFKEFFPNGQRKIDTAYKHGALDGPYSDWFESGQMKSSGSHVDGKKRGPWKTWHPNGQLESEIVFEDGRELPGWKKYFPGGKVSEQLGTDGVFEDFHANGTRRSTGLMGPKGRTGKWAWYDEEGRQEASGAFSNNWAHGEFIWFDEAGRAIARDVFRDGILTSLHCPKGTRLAQWRGFGENDHTLRSVSCRDSKNRDHGLKYEFGEGVGGEYATWNYNHGVSQDYCPDGVDKYYCDPGLFHPPFAVLRQMAAKYAHKEAKNSDVSANSADSGKASDTSTTSDWDACGNGNTDRLPETLDAFVVHADAWRPSALTAPERVQPGQGAKSPASPQGR